MLVDIFAKIGSFVFLFIPKVFEVCFQYSTLFGKIIHNSTLSDHYFLVPVLNALENFWSLMYIIIQFYNPFHSVACDCHLPAMNPALYIDKICLVYCLKDTGWAHFRSLGLSILILKGEHGQEGTGHSYKLFDPLPAFPCIEIKDASGSSLSCSILSCFK